MKLFRKLAYLGLLLSCGVNFCGQANADISYTGGTYTQNFDSLASAPLATNLAWTNDSTLQGWYLFRQPSPGTAVSTYRASAGGENQGSFYSFGNSASDRALGGQGSNTFYTVSVTSGSVAGWFAVGVQNATGSTIDSFTLSFDGEQWRNGGNTNAQTMVLEYGFGSSFTAVASWIAPGGSFNWTSVVNTSTAAAVDGNSTGLVAGRGGTISGLTWINGDRLFVRWVERNDSGNDHGLGIDNFQFSATAVPEPTSFGLLVLTGMSGMAFRRRRS